MVIRLISNAISADTLSKCVGERAELSNKLQGIVGSEGY